MADWNTVAYRGISALVRMLGSIPRPLACFLADGLGLFWYRVDRRHREIALTNLNRAFGDEMSPQAIRRLERRVFQQLARVLFELGWYRRANLQQLQDAVRIDGLSHYRSAAARGKGVLALTCHLGAWEYLSIAGTMVDARINVLYRPLSYPPLERFFRESRSRFGARLIPAAPSMRKILSALHRGESVLMLMDQNFDCHEGVFVDFFGHRACTNKGMALLARATEAPVLPVFMIRQGLGYTAEFGPEIPLIKTEDKTKDIEANTLAYNRAIEAVIRRYPEQWFWVHQRWKTRPYHPWPRQV